MSVDAKYADPAADSLSASQDDFLESLAEANVPVQLVDDDRIEAQLARSERWRYPTWPVVCVAAEKRREKRRRGQAEVIHIEADESETHPRPIWLALLRRYWAGGLISVVLHAALVIMLGVHAIQATHETDDNVLYVISDGRPGERVVERLQVLEISVPSSVRAQASGQFSSPVSAPSARQDPGALPPAVSLATFAERSSGPVGDVQSLFGQDGEGLAAAGTGDEGAQFFGVRATGNRFVFIVDCSRSMTGTKWEDATRELLSAVERLGPDKWFYVIFFDGESHPMFDSKSPEPDLLAATDENLDRFRRWLATVELGFHTRPAASVRFALTLEPHAIYLLSDGEFEDQTAALLREKNLVRDEHGRAPRAIVHTIGFHSRHGQKVLQRIAKEHGGRYVFVPPPQLANVTREDG